MPGVAAAAPSAEATDVPSLDDLASVWVDPNAPVTNITATGLGGDQRDLATINNFWGSVGIAPESVRPVDLFAINSLELPPFAGCGATVHPDNSGLYGCGSLSINGAHVGANATRWKAYEAGRRAVAVPVGGSAATVDVVSATRMAFEANSVLWEVNISNPSVFTAVLDLDLDVAMPVAQCVEATHSRTRVRARDRRATRRCAYFRCHRHLLSACLPTFPRSRCLPTCLPAVASGFALAFAHRELDGAQERGLLSH
jgi:hypothetical protein